MKQQGEKLKNKVKANQNQVLILNKNGTVWREQRIKREHDKIFEYNKYGQVSKVKFDSESLKYNLDDLFQNHSSFYEPMPLYNHMYDVEPPQIQVSINKQGRAGVIYEHETKKEKAIKNNFALINLNKREERDWSVSRWKYFTEMTFNKVLRTDIVRQFDARYDIERYKELKQPHAPMMAYKKKDLEQLKRLCKQFKYSEKQNGLKGGSFIDFTKLKMREDKKEIESPKAKVRRGGVRAHLQIGAITRQGGQPTKQCLDLDYQNLGEYPNNQQYQVRNINQFKEIRVVDSTESKMSCSSHSVAGRHEGELDLIKLAEEKDLIRQKAINEEKR